MNKTKGKYKKPSNKFEILLHSLEVKVNGYQVNIARLNTNLVFGENHIKLSCMDKTHFCASRPLKFFKLQLILDNQKYLIKLLSF